MSPWEGYRHTVITLNMKWLPRENYIKILNEILPVSCGIVLKTLLVLGSLIYWGIILLATFSLLN